MSSTDQKNTFQHLTDDPSSELSNGDDVTGVQVTNEDFHLVKTDQIAQAVIITKIYLQLPLTLVHALESR